MAKGDAKTAKLLRLLKTADWTVPADATTRPLADGGPYVLAALPQKVTRWRTAVLKPDCLELLTGDNPPVVTVIRTPRAMESFKEVLATRDDDDAVAADVNEAIADLEKP